MKSFNEYMWEIIEEKYTPQISIDTCNEATLKVKCLWNDNKMKAYFNNSKAKNALFSALTKLEF